MGKSYRQIPWGAQIYHIGWAFYPQGSVKDLGAILSVHFKPSLDADGRLRLQLERVLAGRLPLPASMWNKYSASLERTILRNLSRFQRQAKLDASGAANSPAVSAAMSKLLLAVLYH